MSCEISEQDAVARLKGLSRNAAKDEEVTNGN